MRLGSDRKSCTYYVGLARLVMLGRQRPARKPVWTTICPSTLYAGEPFSGWTLLALAHPSCTQLLHTAATPEPKLLRVAVSALSLLVIKAAHHFEKGA